MFAKSEVRNFSGGGGGGAKEMLYIPHNATFCQGLHYQFSEIEIPAFS